MLALLALGCPDTQARFDEFLDASQPSRPMGTGMEMGEDSGSESGSTSDLPPDLDVSGTYLFALRVPSLSETPLQFVTTIEAGPTGERATFTFEPLSLDVGSQTAPRMCLGNPLIFSDIPISPAGEFTIDMGLVTVPAAANPITGSEITAMLVLQGQVVHADALCGDLTGMVTMPIKLDLAGATFGMIRLADDGCDPTTLPGMGEFPLECSEVPPAAG